ncbi:MAG TPA: peroxiredoxin-like family protein, partial [Longimicrobiaceae bacterium]|nr:peroxiredoxin-like family protein [Longimicrobiaceae bacterium]
MRTRPYAALALAASMPLIGCAERPAGASAVAEGEEPVPQRAEDVRPLSIGEPAPAALLRDPDGQTLRLGEAYSRAPMLLIFYRGGWCPYCSAHLGEIAVMQEELAELGVQILAISPDRPEKLRESIADRELGYQLLSDSEMSATRAFGLAFQLSEEEVAGYARAGFDLEDASGHD